MSIKYPDYYIAEHGKLDPIGSNKDCPTGYLGSYFMGFFGFAVIVLIMSTGIGTARLYMEEEKLNGVLVEACEKWLFENRSGLESLYAKEMDRESVVVRGTIVTSTIHG